MVTQCWKRSTNYTNEIATSRHTGLR